MDIKFENDDFVLTANYDISLVAPETAQELMFRINTPVGQHFAYPDYGNPYTFIGEPSNLATHMKLVDAFEYMVEAEPTIGECEMSFVYNGNSVEVHLDSKYEQFYWELSNVR